MQNLTQKEAERCMDAWNGPVGKGLMRYPASILPRDHFHKLWDKLEELNNEGHSETILGGQRGEYNTMIGGEVSYSVNHPCMALCEAIEKLKEE